MQSVSLSIHGARLGVLLAGALIVYGSLFPFDFSAPGPLAGQLQKLLATWQPWSSRGDVLGNIGLFVPLGAFAALAARGSAKPLRALLAYFAIGILLALACQIGQIYVPRRTPAMGDVLWNAVGTVVGLILGRPFRSIVSMAPRVERLAFPVVVTAAWLFAQLAPLVPSLSLSGLLDNLRLVLATHFDLVECLLAACGIVVAGVLLEPEVGREWSRRCLALLTVLVAAGKIMVVSAGLTVSTCAGLLAGYWLWAMISKCWRDNAIVIALLFLLVTITVRALEPFAFRAVPGDWLWLPFAHWLQGSMLYNVRSLATSLFLYGAPLFIIAMMSRHVVTSSLMLGIWVLLLEVAQLWIDGRSGDVTEPLLVILVGATLKAMAPMIPHPSDAAAAETTQARPAPRRSQLVRASIELLAASVAMTWAFGMVLSLPNIPYNVRELFLDSGSWLPRFVFALFVLWTGIGAAFAAKYMSGHSAPILRWPLAILGTSIVSLLLLYSSVTDESIADIAGSTNVFWFVTNKDTWGTFARHLFLWLGHPSAINLVERVVRYTALCGPLIVFLCAAWMATVEVPAGRLSMRTLAIMVASAIPWLWLCKGIAFDWSSTDNLNELIARDGDWGIGGGGYLYLLLGLVCINAVLLAQKHLAYPGSVVWAALAVLLALPVGWFLISSGLEGQVRKYGQVFSGVQFLLGPDRSHKLTQEVLFARWCLVQCLATLVIAGGLRIGNELLVAERRKPMPQQDASKTMEHGSPAGAG